MIFITNEQLCSLVREHRRDKGKCFYVFCNKEHERLYKYLVTEYPFLKLSQDESSIKGIELGFDSFHLLPSKLRKAIINDRDALTFMVSKNVKKKRFDHSVSVAKTCEMLAKIHHVDSEKAYIAGLLHDATKEMDEEFHDCYFRLYDEDKISLPLPVKHSFSCKYYLRDKLNLHDKEILDAVYNHTICSSRSKLCRIIYIADKREPLRGLNDGILEYAKKDLNGAYERLVNDVSAYLKQRGSDERIIE